MPLITTAVAAEVQPFASVTLKLYVTPAVKPVMLRLGPVPEVPPGLTVQFPTSGKPVN
jgi:hypothetical protein